MAWSGGRRAAALGLLALAVRLLYIALAGRDVHLVVGEDSISYDRFARLMMSGWHWITTPETAREPLYPVLMAFSYVLPGGEIGVLQIMHALLGAAAVVAVYLTLRSLLDEPVAVLAALILTFHPHFVPFTPMLLRENLVTPLLAGFLCLFLLAVKRDRVSLLFLCALFFTLLAHTDVRFLPLVAVVPFMFLVSRWRPRTALRQTGWFFLFVTLLMVPYQVRGYMARGEPVIITHRFLGKWMDRAGSVVSGDGSAVAVDKRQDWLRQWEERKRGERPAMSPAERELYEAGVRPTLDRMTVHRILFLEYWRIARSEPFYRPYPDGRFAESWSLAHTATSSLVVIPFVLLLPVAVWGGSRAARRVVWPLVLFLFAHTMMHVFVHARERYRIPMEVITSITVAVALVSLWRLARRKRPPARA